MHPATAMCEDYCANRKRSTHVATTWIGQTSKLGHIVLRKLGHIVPFLVFLLGQEFLAGEMFGPHHPLEHRVQRGGRYHSRSHNRGFGRGLRPLPPLRPLFASLTAL